MPVTGTTAASGYTTEQMTEATRTVSEELGKDSFLKLLIAELSNQDPLNPMSDREFVAQMAQFTSLEQMTNLNKTLESMASQDAYSAVNYLGKTVYFDYEDASENVTSLKGTVTSVWYDPDEGPILEIDKTLEIPLKNIHGVANEATDTDKTA